MTILNAVILSIVEGITEFLPISSTGHLILASNLLKIAQSDFVKSFEITIQLGAIFSVIYLYRGTLIKNIDVWKNILIAFVPTALVGLIFYKIIKTNLLGNSVIVAVSLIAGGVFLILFENYYKGSEHNLDSISKVSIKTALLIGLIQSISVIPGVSRAGATIVGAMILGLDRKTSVEFSFLLAIPTMLAATALDLVKSAGTFTRSDILVLIIGFIGAFLAGVVAVRYLLEFIKRHDFKLFGIYRILAGILFLLLKNLW